MKNKAIRTDCIPGELSMLPSYITKTNISLLRWFINVPKTSSTAITWQQMMRNKTSTYTRTAYKLSPNKPTNIQQNLHNPLQTVEESFNDQSE